MTANDPPIADVHAALLARRYPPVFVELHFDIRAAPGSASDERRAMSDEATGVSSPKISNSPSPETRNSKPETSPPASGRYVLSIRNGKPAVQRGGTGHIMLDIHAFTALYHNRVTPAELRQTHRLTAPDEDLAALTRAFASP